ncbi:MAG TPA: extracellular solute-binding protein, partial [Acetivibrio clariflavus]|nr:extracellular solute-binding protein [Acetivibrio clariflavus]
DITDLFPKYAPNYYRELKSNKMGEESLYNSSINGKIYSVPCNAFNCPRYFIVARKDLVDKYANGGFETLEDYGDFLKSVKENEPDLIPGAVYSRTFFDAYMKGNGYYNYQTVIFSNWEGEEKNLYLLEDTEEFSKAYSLLENWRKNGYAPKNPYSYDKSSFISKGLLASLLTNSDEVHNRGIDEGLNDYGYRMYPLYLDKTHVIMPKSKSVAVAKNSKNPERVLMFIEWLHKSQENYDLFRFGVNGRNYSLDGENISYPEGIQQITYWWNTVTDFFIDYRYERIGFPDTLNYREVIKEASLNNIVTQWEMYEKFEYRLMDEDELKKVNEEWDSLSPILRKYEENMYDFYEYMDEGLGTITPEKLREMQKEAGIDRVLEFYKKDLLKN